MPPAKKVVSRPVRYLAMSTTSDHASATSVFGDSALNPLSTTSASTQLPQLHQIRRVRLREGVELRAVARRMGKGTQMRRLRREEHPETDMHLSDLLRWQRALSVPLTDLLIDDDRSLSPAVMERAHMLRVMKTVVTIYRQSSSDAIRKLVQSMIDELAEVMPELIDVGPWQGRETQAPHDYGRAAEYTVSDSIDRFATRTFT